MDNSSRQSWRPPRDPRDLLSPESRKRIEEAHGKSEAIRIKALADGEWEHRHQEPESILTAYLLRSPAYRQAKLDSALVILRCIRSEFEALPLPDKQFWQIMREEVEACVNSLELTDLDRRWLESEVVWAPRPGGAKPSDSASPLPLDRQSLYDEWKRRTENASYKELHARTGVHPKDIGKWKRGDPKFPDSSKVSQAIVRELMKK